MRMPVFPAVLLMLAGALSTTPARAEIPLATGPLFLSTSVAPNVMLLFDNSGSMRNMIWASGYDPAATYTDWSLSCGNNGSSACWTADDTIVTPDDFARGSCASGWTQGRKSGGSQPRVKCLKLPKPLGNDTRYYGSYLNYLFNSFASGTDLTSATKIPQETRLQTAQNVSTTLVNSNTTLRWGLARFNAPIGQGNSYNGAPGGKVVADCGSSTSSITDAIGKLNADTNTPLAETFYEITRYFRGQASAYESGISYTSPIQYRCQKNFVIVVTDGFPTWDNNFPSNDAADVADSFKALPNWDNRKPSTRSSDYPFFPKYSDGFFGEEDTVESQEAYTLYLDDLAKFGYDIDLKTSGNDLTGTSYQDSNFKIQRLQTYTVGLAINNQMLQDAAEYGQGKAYTASNASQLQSALQSALNDIASRTSAAASVATNSTRLTADTAIYQARFSTGDWSGELQALEVTLDGSIGATRWDAADSIPAAASRTILTYDPTAAANNRGKNFLWNQLNSSQAAALNKDSNGTTDGLGQSRLNYLRGDRSSEGDAAPAFRRRNASTVLGDIVNSDPAFAGQQDYGFEKLPGSEGSSYASFRGSNAYLTRPSVVYVGANDGMLHGFRASDGVELMAYVPNAVYGSLSLLSGQNYNQNHRFFVDGSPRVLDARIGNAWKTVLLGTLGGGGKAVFALDVTTPASFGTAHVLWEFSSASDADMGYSYPQATIARLANGKWAAIVGNGYNSTAEKAVLYVIDLENGSVIRKFDTGVSGNNGMSSPIPVDVDGDRITDLLYAGDLKGNLWKIDVRDANAANWDFDFKSGSTPLPLFTACNGVCSASTRQAITARPEVGIHPDGGYVIYFGTGSYFAGTDNTTSGVGNTFYAIHDKDDGMTRPGGRVDLFGQQVVLTVEQAFGTQTEKVRVTTNNQPQDDDLGWYLDLPAAGERQVSTPILRGGRIIFTTLIPNTAACGFGGDSFLMEIDAISGSRLDSPPFDLNRDTAFNEEDMVLHEGVLVPVSGRQSKEGIIKTPAIISAGAFEVKLASGTTGGIDTTIEPPPGIEPGGRQSWRQLQ